MTERRKLFTITYCGDFPPFSALVPSEDGDLRRPQPPVGLGPAPGSPFGPLSVLISEGCVIFRVKWQLASLIACMRSPAGI
jgi:hypothetical protein